VFPDDFSSDEEDATAADEADEDDEEYADRPRCKALYHYSAKLNDELNLRPGKWQTASDFNFNFNFFLSPSVRRRRHTRPQQKVGRLVVRRAERRHRGVPGHVRRGNID